MRLCLVLLLLRPAATLLLHSAAIAQCSSVATPRCGAVAASASDLLSASAAWPKLQADLDNVPVFAVANKEGKPLQYNVGGKPQAVMYADVEAAKKELATAQGEYPDLECDLIPVGLGSAYKLACDGKAMVVPALSELVAAGAPADAQPMGQELPLFVCMKMSQGDDLPLFLSFADLNAAIAEASAGDAPDDAHEPMEVSPLSLASVVERVVGSAEPDAGAAFSFVAPEASIRHVESYVGSGIYWRPVDEEAEQDGE